MSRTTTILTTLLIAVVAALVINLQSSPAQVGGRFVQQELTYVIEGDFQVSYDGRQPAGQFRQPAAGQFDQQQPDRRQRPDDTGIPEIIRRIEFHEDCIILINQFGGGKVLPLEGLSNFSFEPI